MLISRSTLPTALAAALLATTAIPAFAQNNPNAPDSGAGGTVQTTVAAADTSGKPSAEEGPAATPSIQTALGPYGDPGGIRAFLEKKGITYNFTYIGEVLGNPTGGFKRGATYEGRLDVQFDVDLEKLGVMKNAALHANFYQIHGRGLSGNNLLDLFTTSGIEAYPSTKLYEAWYEQKFADGKLFFRVGQLAADTEFFVSQTATLFVNSTFGWPASFANDLPSGGPAYPLATPGVRFKYAVNDNVTLLAALFNGDPAGAYRPGVNNILPQIRDLGGTTFRVDNPPFLLTEAQFVYNQEKDAKGLPGTVKIGYFHHFESFPNFATGGPVTVRGDDGIYGIVDQTIYKVPGTSDQGAAVFARISASPGDRNVIDLYLDGGVAYKGIIKGRPDDTAGLSFAYGRVSPEVQNQDYIAGGPLIRDFQAVIEATYQYVVLPGFSIQPDFQYVFHPGAHGVADPNNAGQPIKDAAVFGMRATVHY